MSETTNPEAAPSPYDAVIRALELIHPRETVVENAERLADAVAAALRATDIVVVDLHGVGGVSSAYFQVVQLRALEEFGDDAVRRRLRFQTTSDLHRKIIERSTHAILTVP
jgi:hypothetical protein